METKNNNNHHRLKSSSSDNSVYLDAQAASIHSTTSSGHIDRDSSSASQNVEATGGAVGVVTEAETSSRGQCKKAAKAAKNHGLLARFFDETVPHKKRLRCLKKASMVNDNGTVEIEVPGHIKHRSLGNGTGIIDCSGESCKETLIQDIEPIPPKQIAMLIVGTRGDVQPFIAIGKRLQEDGHRVRLATHKNFEDFVLDAGLEFYPLGGDPKVLAGYMVKNKGLLPSGPSEIHIQRNQIRAIIHSLLPACNSRYPDSNKPFRAEAIIANPPAYGHTHVAEYLNVPLHIFFTMPWTPTSEFHHPLSRVRQPIGYKLSYQIVDALIWLGIHDLVNEFRKKKLKLGAMTHHLRGSYTSPPEMPYGYIWSPNLVPKPKDWGPNIDIVGFCFLDLASNYEPPKPLVDWLEEGKNPIYVGFGSLPLQEPEKVTRIVVHALQQTGQRGIINKGWGGLGNLAELKNSKSVYLLDNCPHDWLFPRCTAVVHHGGAGTTAAGLRAECPTTIVPFFGDQPFWGERVHARGVGPSPIPVADFTLERLVDAIRFMLNPEVKRRAVELANAMKNEDGVVGAVNAFYKHYPRQRPDTETEPKQVALVNRHFSIRGCFGCYNSSG